ncbi:MAG TPA: lipopolysaccharide biosynthesis protein [Polyangiaceae bacterium]|jgi:stage V sporulation protein B
MPAAPLPQSPANDKDTARAAGRGGIAVLGAKAFFILSGLLQQTLLPRVIGLAGFGALSRVLAVANVVNNVVVASATQGVSRAVARAHEHHREALRAGLRVHLIAALGAAALFALASPLVAGFEGASYIALPLLVMAGVVACYGVYAAFVGALNGTKRFSQQAALDVTFAVLRTVGILGLGWLFVRRGQSGVVGATLGFVLAAACIVPLAARWTGLGKKAPGPLPDVPSAPEYVKGLVPVAIAQLFTNAVMQIDITLLGHFLSASGASVEASKQADVWIGVYRACQLFAFLPYQLLFSVTQILFPLVATAHAGGNAAEVKQYVARGARIGAIACGLMVAVIVAMPGSLLAFAFPAEIAERGASTLRILALGQGAFAMMGLAATVLVSLGRERDAALITLAALILVGIGCFGAVPWQPFGGAQLVVTAIATSVALAVGLGLAAARVTQVAGAFIPVKTAARVAVGVALALVAGFRLPSVGKLLTPIEAAGIGVLFVGILAGLGELGSEDLALVTALVRRRGGAKA